MPTARPRRQAAPHQPRRRTASGRTSPRQAPATRTHRTSQERSVAGTTLEDVKAAAAVSGSQLYHYFPDKDTSCRRSSTTRPAPSPPVSGRLTSAAPTGSGAWRDTVIAQAKSSNGRGGCPLGSLAGQLAETDPHARALIAAGFEQWSAAISDGLRELQAAGLLPAAIDADDYAITLLAALQGGLLLAQTQQDTRPLETAVDTLLALTARCGA